MSCLYRREDTFARPSLPLLFMVTKSGSVPTVWLHVRIDLADIATVAHVLAIDVRANADNAVGRRDAATGLPAHSRVEDAAGVVKERATTDGGIEVAGGVIGKRVSTDVRVHVAGRVAKERAIAYGSVEVACGVALKRAVTGGGVVVAFGVTRECQRTTGGIEVACGLVMQCRNASGRISSPPSCYQKVQQHQSPCCRRRSYFVREPKYRRLCSTRR